MRRFGAVLLVTLLGAGCVTQQARTMEQAAAGLTPALVVERFLRAVNANELMTMARLFGTREGSVLHRDPRRQVERRMFVLASVLRHDDYTLERKRIAPGRLGNAVTVVVRMRFGERETPVPFTVVRSADDAWLIERVDIERITARGG